MHASPMQERSASDVRALQPEFHHGCVSNGCFMMHPIVNNERGWTTAWMLAN